MVVILSPSALGAVRMTVDEYLAAGLPAGHRSSWSREWCACRPRRESRRTARSRVFSDCCRCNAERRPDLVAHITQRSAVTLPQRHVVREPDLA